LSQREFNLTCIFQSETPVFILKRFGNQPILKSPCFSTIYIWQGDCTFVWAAIYFGEGAERIMLEKCVNPFCNQPFRYFGHGKLFVLEFPPRFAEHRHHVAGRREHFWLCEECSRIMTIAVRRDFDSVSVRIINLAPNGLTKLAYPSPLLADYLENDFVHSVA
jgi:hypothetical protein